MNILGNTEELGGMPLKLNDLRWIINGLMEAFKGVASPFGVSDSTAVILSGCNRSVLSGTVTISSGYVSIGGEICFVPEHSYSAPGVGELEYFVLYVSYDETGLKAFKNPPIPTLIDTYHVRRARIEVSETLPSGHTLYASASRFFSAIGENTYTVKTGMCLPYYGTTGDIPEGYLLCDGSSLLVDEYPGLHAVIGYRNGGSAESFNLPNLVDRFVMGSTTSGGTGGQNAFTISAENLPEHDHDITDPGHGHTFIGNNGGTVTGSFGAGAITDFGTSNTSDDVVADNTTGITIQPGGGVADPEAIDNRPAYSTALWIIKI